MQTTTIGAMRLVMVVVMATAFGAGACGGDPLHPSSGSEVDAGGAGGAAGQVDAGGADRRPTAADLVGHWCSPSFGELDLEPNGAYVSVLAGQRSEGTWVTDGTYLTFLGPHGEAGAVQTIVAVAPASLTLTGFSGQLTFERCQ